jgi:hypothetical protein
LKQIQIVTLICFFTDREPSSELRISEQGESILTVIDQMHAALYLPNLLDTFTNPCAVLAFPEQSETLIRRI